MSISLYVVNKETNTVVSVYTCNDETVDRSDAAAGCEHAAGQRYGSDVNYSLTFTEQPVPEGAEFRECPPLSKAPLGVTTKEDVEKWKAAMLSHVEVTAKGFEVT